MASKFDTEERAVLTHQPCDDCGSTDAKTYYEKHSYCFKCEKHRWLDQEDAVDHIDTSLGLIEVGRFDGIQSRKIPEAICRKYGYSKSRHNGKKVQLAPYRNQANKTVGQKVRTADKDFYTTGKFTDVQLFGQHLWKPGRRLVITEGELDCLSYATAVNGRWPCVSIPNGTASAEKAIKRNIEFVEGFQEVVILFDMDEPGQKAAEEVAEILTPGKACIAQLPLKDASDMLVANRIEELTRAVWEAQPKRPDGIKNGKEIWDEVSSPIRSGKPYTWSGWNTCLFGSRPRELLTVVAGTGVGKSTVVSELAYNAGNIHHQNVGYVALEEGLGRTGLRLMSIEANKPLHIPNTLSDKDRREAFDKTLGTGRYFLYDHFGSIDSENLLRKFQYMVTALGVEVLILDHLSILVSGMDQEALSNYGDERKAIDYTMTQLRSFTERTNVSMILVSHLRRPQGDKGHEGGEKVYLSHLRSSASIAQLSDAVVSISRDMSSGENRLEVNCLKNRYAGITGPMCTLEYNPETGRLAEIADEFGEDFEP